MIEYKIYNKKAAGIYKLICAPNGKIYIGKSIRLRHRLKEHSRSENSKRDDLVLVRAIKKYGVANFKVEILEFYPEGVDNNFLLKREAELIKLYDATNPEIGYNTTVFAMDRMGTKHSPE